MPLAALACLALLPQVDVGAWQSVGPGGGGWYERIAVGPTGTLLACSDLSGASLSLDHGAHWVPVGRGAGLATTHVACATFHPTDPARLFLGTEDGVYRSTDGGATVHPVLVGGYVESVVYAPTAPSVVYAARHSAWNVSDGHVHASTDGGATFTRVDVDFPAGHRILELLVARSSPTRVFALTGDGRFAGGPADVLRSDDGGVHWVSLGAAFGGRVIDLALTPDGPEVLYASVDDPVTFALGHLYRSVDGGQTWTFVSRRSGHVWPVAGTASTVRMIDGRYPYPWHPELEGLWESTAGGAAGSWVKASSAATWDTGWSGAIWAANASSNHAAFAADPSAPDTLVWVNSQFVFATSDGGRTVRPLHTAPAGGGAPARFRSTGFDNTVVVDVEVSATQPGHVYAGFFDLGLWASHDGGASWFSCNQPAATGAWGGAGGNTRCVLTDPTVPGRVWAPEGEDPESPSTLLRSDDAGLTWTAVGAGLPAAPVLGLALDRTSPQAARRLFASAEGDVYRSVDGGGTWTRVLARGGLRFTAVDRFDAQKVYAGGEAGFWRSTDGGATWAETGPAAMRGGVPGLPAPGWTGVHDLTSDPHVAGRVFVAVTGPGRGLFVSHDSGQSFVQLTVEDHLRAVEVDPLQANVLVCASSSAYSSGGFEPTSRGVTRSTDSGATWSDLSLGLDWPFALDVAFAPGPACTLFAASPGMGIARRDLCGPCRTQRVCPATPNSTGARARLELAHSPSLADASFVLRAEDVPPNQTTLFVYGGALVQVPFGNGAVCVGGGAVGLVRLLPPASSSVARRVGRVLDFGAPPVGSGAAALAAGTSYVFQALFRDALGTGVNLTDALVVTLCP